MNVANDTCRVMGCRENNWSKSKLLIWANTDPETLLLAHLWYFMLTLLFVLVPHILLLSDHDPGIREGSMQKMNLSAKFSLRMNVCFPLRGPLSLFFFSWDFYNMNVITSDGVSKFP